MNVSAVQAGDIVHCDVRGREFFALVDALHKEHGELAIKPLDHRLNYFHVTARQVTGHWRKAGRPRPNRKLDS